MGRIRTIKPEFPQSQSMGRVSRESRLLFILLWTIVDDEGRTRAASRMLASLLYPYDDDANALILSWLTDLEANGCIRRYSHDGNDYLEICKWSDHQKIDRPSKSKIPSFVEASRGFASDREDSTTDQGPGPGSKDHGSGVDAAASTARGTPPPEASPIPTPEQRQRPPSQEIEDDPQPATMGAKPRNVFDLQAEFPKVYMPSSEERQAWAAVLDEFGYDILRDSCMALGRNLPEGKRILLSQITMYLANNYRKKSG